MNCSIACLLKIDSNLSIYPYIHKYILFEAREVIASFFFFFLFLYFLFDMYVCTKRWRSLAARMIYLPWKFIHLRCLLCRLSCIYSKRVYLSIIYRHEEKKNNKKKEVWTISFYFSNFIDRWNALFSFFFAYLFTRHIQPRHWHVIPCWSFLLCRPAFLFLAYLSHTN